MEITVVPSENGSFQPSTNAHNESQAFKIEIFSGSWPLYVVVRYF